MKLSKAQRQYRIAQLLADHEITSQDQLVELLARHDIEATQATVSRDLDDLAAIKVRVPGGSTAYAVPALPSDRKAPMDHLRRVLGEWVVDVASSANLVVLRTPPGSAHVVGSAIDRSGHEAIIGSVAGDDTVMVVVLDEVGGPAVAAELAELAGLVQD